MLSQPVAVLPLSSPKFFRSWEKCAVVSFGAEFCCRPPTQKTQERFSRRPVRPRSRSRPFHFCFLTSQQNPPQSNDWRFACDSGRSFRDRSERPVAIVSPRHPRSFHGSAPTASPSFSRHQELRGRKATAKAAKFSPVRSHEWLCSHFSPRKFAALLPCRGSVWRAAQALVQINPAVRGRGHARLICQQRFRRCFRYRGRCGPQKIPLAASFALGTEYFRSARPQIADRAAPGRHRRGICRECV